MGTRAITKKAQYQLYRSNDLNALGPSGDVIQLTASGTLKIGDVVYYSAASTVAKSATGSNHDKIAGVVIGGQSTYDSIIDDSALVGTTAATDGQRVLVLLHGIAYVVVAAAIAAGVAIVADTATAGRVKAATAHTATAADPTQATTTQVNSTVPAGATPVTSSAANGAIITAGAITNGAITAGAITVAGEGNNRIIGKVINAGAGAASVVLAWINVH